MNKTIIKPTETEASTVKITDSTSGDYTISCPEVILGQPIKGIVSMISRHRILVDIAGGFLTGIIPASEMGSQITVRDIKIGDQISATVVEPENDEGMIVLSLRKSSEADTWKYFDQIHINDETIVVKATDANKGGLLINIQGIKGFLPVSQLSPEHYPRVNKANADDILTKLKSYIGKEFQVKILTLDEGDKKLIFSERKVLAAEREESLKKIEPGMIVKGKISGIVDFGAFVTFDGLEGLLHISEISWNKVNKPSDYLAPGQDIEVMILAADNKKISLSMKRLTEDPWIKAAENFKVGDTVEGPVTQLADYGAFVRLTNEVNGLLHITEMADPQPSSPTEVVKIGDTIKAKIIALDLNEHRVGLSLIAMDKKDEN